MRKLFVMIATVTMGLTVLLAPSAQAATPDANRQVVKQSKFYCNANFTNVIRRDTFGQAGWVLEVGMKADGTRAVYVSHPSARTDNYKLQLFYPNGGSSTVQSTDSSFCAGPFRTSDIIAVKAMARNGGAWYESRKLSTS